MPEDLLIRIVDLDTLGSWAADQAAALLVEGFAEHWPDTWPDLGSAADTVRESLAGGRICRAAVDPDHNVLGWSAAEPIYGGNVWELNVLVVLPARQRQGIGRALLTDLDQQVHDRGGLTIWLGSDDEDGMTSLAGVDLYPDPLWHLSRIADLKGHPFEFYRKMGFSLAGVLPDANGPGKPDIFLAKPVARWRVNIAGDQLLWNCQ